MTYLHKALLVILKLLLYLSVALFLLFATGPGRSLLVSFVNFYVSDSDVKLNVSSINSLFPLRIDIAGLKVSEGSQDYLHLQDVELKANLLKLYQENDLKISIVVGKMAFKNLKSGDSEAVKIPDSLSIKLPCDLSIDFACNRGKILNLIDNEAVLLEKFSAYAFYASGTHKVEIGSFMNILWQGSSIDVALQGSCQDNVISGKYSLKASNVMISGNALKDSELLGVIKGSLPHIKSSAHLKFNVPGLGDVKSDFQFFIENDLLSINFQGFQSEAVAFQGTITHQLSGKISKGDMSATFKEFSLPEVDTQLDGTLNLSGTLDLHDWSVVAEASLGNVRAMGVDLEAITLASHLKSRGAILTGALRVLGKTITTPTSPAKIDTLTITGEVKDGKGEMRLQAQGQEIESILKATFQQMPSEIDAKIHKASIKYHDVSVKALSPLSMSFKQNLLKLQPAKFSVNEVPVDCHFEKAGDNISGSLSGKLNINVLSELLLPPSHFVEGLLVANVKVSGTVDAPLVAGHLNLEKGRYENLEGGIYLNDIHAAVTSQGSVISMNALTAQSHETGEIKGKGEVNLETKELALDLVGQNFTLNELDYLQTFVERLKIKIAGSWDHPVATGEVILAKGKLDISQLTHKEMRQINIKKEVGLLPKVLSAQKTQPWSMGLDLTASCPNTLSVKGRGLNTLWGGQINILGRTDAPQISGKLSLSEGTLALLGSSLQLLEGSIIFNGQPDLNPYVRVLMGISNDDFDMKVLISGLSDNLQFTFSSTPPLPKEEIMSQILFNKVTTDLNAFEALQLARSIGVLMGSGPSLDIMGTLANFVGVDSIDVGLNEDQSGASIRVDKKLNSRLKVILDQNTNREESKVEIEAKIFKNVTANIEHSLVKSDDSVSLNYKKDY